MSSARTPSTLSFRLTGLLLSRKFWIAVAAVVVAALVVYSLVAVPVGPTAFSFKFSSNACTCTHTASTNHTFPARAYVTMSFHSHFLGPPVEYILLVYDPAGVEIIYGVMSSGSVGGAINYANLTEVFTTTSGGAFEFTVEGVEPVLLPGINAWVNGTYTAPILSV
ncbi:MAG: hypothetical protein L3J97_04145 [Thermoplasmata archaeon]|nr:hypothetical protein [Thermoplasmata archaeon]